MATHKNRSKSTGPRSQRGPIASLLALIGAGSAVTLGVIFACAELPDPQTPTSVADDSAAKAVHSSRPEDSEPKPETSYADAIRRHQFDRAAWLIDAAPDDEKKSPEVRYARALVALELDDVETALRSVDKLEDTWPLFAREAKELRLTAAKQSKDVTLLAHFLEDSKSIEEKLVLAEAHEKSSSVLEARKLADEVLQALASSKRRDKLSLQARARALKARTLIAEDKKSEAAKEYKWLATSAASLELAADLDDKIVELDPSMKLSAQERLSRAKTFSEKGWVKRTEDEIAQLKEAPGNPASAKETEALVAWAVYTSRSDYERASQLFASAAAHGGKDKQKNLYYEAKALARSHRDAEAIEKYEKVAKMGGGYTDHAAYQAARLKFIDGQWKAAVKDYEKYLKRFGRNAKHRDGAKYDLPIARLAAEDYAKAINELSGLLKVEKSERNRSRLMELQAVAMLGAGQVDKAKAQFKKVIEFRPLSFPALAAGARLVEMGEPMPPLINPARSLTPEQQALKPLSLSLPEKVWRLDRVGLDALAETELKREEQRIKAQYGPRGGEALCQLYGQLESAKRRFQVAQYAARWQNLKDAPNERTRWEWNCIYPTPYREIAEHEGALRDISTAFIYGVMRQESAFRPSVVSPAAAVGLMQIIPPTAQRIAGEIDFDWKPELMNSPAVNIRFGTYYLRRLMDTFGNRPLLSAAGYNAGPHAVTRWLRAGENLPADIFVARIPYKETRNYVYRVMGNIARYSYLDDKLEVQPLELQLPKGLKAPEDFY